MAAMRRVVVLREVVLQLVELDGVDRLVVVDDGFYLVGYVCLLPSGGNGRVEEGEEGQYEEVGEEFAVHGVRGVWSGHRASSNQWSMSCRAMLSFSGM